MSFNRTTGVTAKKKREREEDSDLASHKKARKETANISTSSSSAQVIVEPPQETIHRLFNELVASKKTILELTKELAASKDTIIKLSTDNDELNNELVDNVQYVDTAEDANISLRYELAVYEQKLKEYEAAFAAHQEVINNQGFILNDLVNKSTAEISTLKSEIATLKRENMQFKITNVRSLAQELKEVQRNFTAFKNSHVLQINSKNAEIALLKAQLEQAKADKASAVKPQRPVLTQSAQMGILKFTPSTSGESLQSSQALYTPLNGSQGIRRSGGGNFQ